MVAQRVMNLFAMQEIQVQFLDLEDQHLATHSSLLAGKSHGQSSLADYSPCGRKRVGHDLATKQHV